MPFSGKGDSTEACALTIVRDRVGQNRPDNRVGLPLLLLFPNGRGARLPKLTYHGRRPEESMPYPQLHLHIACAIGQISAT